MADLTLVTYCGLYCGLCAQRGRIPRQAAALKDSMAKEGFEFFGGFMPGFHEFWAFLGKLCDPDQACRGCRRDGGPPDCEIRDCARKRGVEICPLCDEYPCERLAGLARAYPTLIADGRRLAAIGGERWLAEQEERAKTGFAYVDIRCQLDDIPTELGWRPEPPTGE